MTGPSSAPIEPTDPAAHPSAATAPRDFVQSLERGLQVIRAFDGEHPELTLSDVSRRTGMTRAAVRRFLLTLEQLGYVHHEGRTFSLRPSILDLGFAYLSSMGLPEVAAPHLETLVATLHESSSMSVLDGSDVVYIARMPSRRRIMTVSIAVGTRFPAYATSMGRVLLAALDPAALDDHLATTPLIGHTAKTITDQGALRAVLAAVAADGFAIVDQELEDGLRSVAAPVRHDGRVVAAVNVSVHASRTSVADIRERILPHLLRACAEIASDYASLR